VVTPSRRSLRPVPTSWQRAPSERCSLPR
jgi:hypothetical protein